MPLNFPTDIGSITVKHRGQDIIASTGSVSYDAYVANLPNLYSHKVGFIPAGYEHRPDLISNLFYGSPKYWWLLMLVNNISDPFEGFNVNDRILIPEL